ncbi:MAG: hypothetical protein ACHQ7N_04070 [Candidatus Methylomirabilales bacterium]
MWRLIPKGIRTRVIRDIILLAPSLVITDAQVDRIMETLRDGISAVLADRV